MSIEAVFLDVGNTVIYADPPVGEVYARALRRAGIEAAGDEVGRAFRSAWRRLRARRADGDLEYGMTEGEALEWWRAVVRESLSPFGCPDSFEEVFRELWDHFAEADAWRVYDDVGPTLEALRRRVGGVGLISNWDVRLARVLRELGLEDRFDWAVISFQVGAEKPAPVIFRRALERCGAPPERAMHVGDSYEEDVLGALQAGMRAVWLVREENAEGAFGADVPVIRTLADLPAMLD